MRWVIYLIEYEEKELTHDFFPVHVDGGHQSFPHSIPLNDIHLKYANHILNCCV